MLDVFDIFGTVVPPKERFTSCIIIGASIF